MRLGCASRRYSSESSDIDSQRMSSAPAGKGHKDRYVMLSEVLLLGSAPLLAGARPPPWLFPSGKDCPIAHRRCSAPVSRRS